MYKIYTEIKIRLVTFIRWTPNQHLQPTVVSYQRKLDFLVDKRYKFQKSRLLRLMSFHLGQNQTGQNSPNNYFSILPANLDQSVLKLEVDKYSWLSGKNFLAFDLEDNIFTIFFGNLQVWVKPSFNQSTFIH